MKKISLFFTAFLFIIIQSLAQTGTGDDFQRTTLGSAWTPNAQNGLTLNANSQLLVQCTGAGVGYSGFPYSFSAIDVTDAPYVSIKIKTGTSFTLRIDMIDVNGRRTNQTDTKQVIKADNTKFLDYLFDFTGKFYQAYGSNNGPVLSTQISRIEFIINPSAPGSTGFSGSFFMDSVMVGSRAKSGISNGSKGIKFNQLGFFTDGYKQAVVNGASATEPQFYIVNEAQTDTVYSGNLTVAKQWSYSGESVRIADFSNFKIPGKYKMRVPGITIPSYTFSINKTVLNGLSKGSIKGFYFQRASTELPAQYAGKWARPAGHPDTKVLIHNSAATSARPTGSSISSPRGWYDAGDYNKYIVNSGISTYTLLACYEHFPTYYDTLKLNIPESNNSIPDVLDEALWNVRWMLTMQDTDGGVYHKLTNKDFDGDNVMPANATTPRYVVLKSSAATLDFAAVMAQASRIFANYPNQLPGLSDSCIKASAKAFEWASGYSAMFYEQKKLTNPAITTGGYENGTNPSNLTDEMYWAAAELFTTTLKPWYYEQLTINRNVDIPGWDNVYTLGLISMAHNRLNIVDSLPIASDTTIIKSKIINLASGYRNEAITKSAYGIAMGADAWNFNWGSNAIAANQALILIQAFNYTKDSTYLKAALSNLDYLMGRNATGYSYVTGFGSKPANNIHHRPSQADGISDAVPGLLVGGPNPGQQDRCSGYPSTLPGLSYLDSECSYSTNEIAINWNAPLAYISGSLQSIFSGIQPQAKSYKVEVVTANKDAVIKNIKVALYPNPTSSNLFVVKPFELIEAPMILDLNGNEYPVTGNWDNDTFEINTSNLSNGMYLIRLQGENGAAVQKFTVLK